MTNTNSKVEALSDSVSEVKSTPDAIVLQQIRSLKRVSSVLLKFTLVII